MAGLADPVDRAAEHRHLDRVLVGLQAALDLGDDAVHVELQPAAGGAGDQTGPALAELQRLEDLPGDLDLLLGVEGRQRDPDRVADPVGEQRPEADRGLQRARSTWFPPRSRRGAAGTGSARASSRFEAIVFGTLVDFIETLKLVKSSRSISSTNSTAAVTSASTGFVVLELAQMLGQRAGVDADPQRRPELAWRARRPRATLSGPPMLPGFRRTQCAPASSALSASVWLKWMSAITGIGDCATIVLQRLGVLLARHGAAHDVGAAPRRRGGSGPSSPARSAVSVLVIVWTATGAPPPIGTAPTWIWRCGGHEPSVERRVPQLPTRRLWFLTD